MRAVAYLGMAAAGVAVAVLFLVCVFSVHIVLRVLRGWRKEKEADRGRFGI